ncbi:MAG: MATE family efflux transporter [Bacteroidaceae bacterium]|nr:MATE family efflux transporter [Bacteroidaceae bacterium]
MHILSAIFATDSRTALVRKNILFSFLIKGWSALVVLLLVPLTLDCVGAYSNGVWLTISSMLMWIDNMDIGLGNGLRNRIAACMAGGRRDEAREAVSSTLAMLCIVIVPVCIILCALALSTDLYAFLNIDDRLSDSLPQVVAVSIVLVCATFVFKFVGNVYLGLQLQAVNNLLQTLGQTLVLVGTLVLWLSGSHSLLHIAIVNTAAPLLVWMLSYPVTFHRHSYLRPRLSSVRLGMIRSLFTVGVEFFVIQIAGVVLFMSTNILISRLFSPEMVTPYQIAYRYFYIPLLAFIIFATPYWSATTDAFHRGDYDWLHRSARTLDRILLCLLAVVAFMTLVSGFVYSIWIGSRAEVPLGITLLMALYIAILIASLRYSFILNGLGALRLQLITTVSAAIIFVPLAVFVARLTGDVLWFVAVLCAVNLPGLLLNRLQCRKIIHHNASGIWIR